MLNYNYNWGDIMNQDDYNNDNNRKLYTLILDISKSMNQISHFIIVNRDKYNSIIP